MYKSPGKAILGEEERIEKKREKRERRRGERDREREDRETDRERERDGSDYQYWKHKTRNIYLRMGVSDMKQLSVI